MSATLEKRLVAAVGNTPLRKRLRVNAAPLLEKQGALRTLPWREEAVVRGLARVAASSPDAARFLANRTRLLARLPGLDASYLECRLRELEGEAGDQADLEAFLDALRVLRREETVLAACLHLGGLVPFERVADFLSVLAEVIVVRALAAAQRLGAARHSPTPVAVIGMGRIGGREFTYHSDLDLLFLYEGDAEAITVVSRTVQRLIAYLSTMTGAGIAYAVDTRLRPSGQQGTLVTRFESFERYQTHKAQPWEHLALVRARVIAGDLGRGENVLDRVRRAVFGSHTSPWQYVADMRRRVERERAREEGRNLDLKTGPGGLMDVEFLAEGGVLELGPPLLRAAPPSIPALLRASVAGQRVDGLLEDYRFLRRVEAVARWLAGRPVTTVAPTQETFPLLAELVEPGMTAPQLMTRLDESRRRIRQAFCSVIAAGRLAALAD